MRERINLNLENYSFHLSPLHPFTPAQADVLDLYVNGYTLKEIAYKLHVSRSQVRNTVCGKQKNGSCSEIGILGVINSITGSRPKNRGDVIRVLLDDVVFWNKKPEINSRLEIAEQNIA